MHRAELPSHGLFRGVRWSEVRAALTRAPVLEIDEGEVLVGPGEALDCVYVVLSGRVGVFVSRSDGEPIMLLGPGEPVGELAAIDGGPRSAWVLGQERGTRVAEIPTTAFRELLQRSHTITLNLVHLVARRVRRSNEALEERAQRLVRSARAGTRDALTGVMNRRWFDQSGPAVVAEARQRRRPLSLVLFDVDHFKRINDTLGHPAGDAVLVELGKQLRHRFRRHDEVARYGGEEFVVVLPGTPLESAVEAVDRVRQSLAFTGVPVPAPDGERSCTVARFTVSAGVATLRPDDTLSTLVGRADQALYKAKAEGRNRVVHLEAAQDSLGQPSEV